MLINFDVSSSTLGTPEDFEANGISDHAPLAFVLLPKTKSTFTPRPIPRKTCRDPLFCEEVTTWAADINLLAQQAANQLYLYNKIIVESARCVRNFSLFHSPDGRDNFRIVVDSFAWAIWVQDHMLAKKLVSHSQLASEYSSPTGF